ncbi:MAG: response regulator transcription factor [Actinomycetota bacterium]
MSLTNEDTSLPLLLLVADDETLPGDVQRAIGPQFRIWTATSARSVSQRITSTPPDFIIIEVPSPTSWQFDFIAGLRGTTGSPMMVLTRELSPHLCVLSLRMGADDHVVLPTEDEVIAARVHALRRRVASTSAPDTVKVADLEVHHGARTVSRNGRPLHLTPIEFDLLAYLMKHPRQALSRDQLLVGVWGSESRWQSPATVTEHVRRLRLKLGVSEGLIATVYGMGYRFDPSNADRNDPDEIAG